MKVFVNGEEKEIESGLGLLGLLEKFQINPQTVVIERNEIVVSRQTVAQTPLEEGDKIEIVRFVGGG